MVCRCKTGITYRRSPTVLELFAVSVVLFAVASGMAVPTDSFQEANESNSSGLEWSLVTGLNTLLFYSHKASAQEPPIVMTEDNTVAQIIWTVCDLLMQYELVNKVDSTGDLQVILKQNLMDLCNWIRALNATGDVTLNKDVAANCSYSPEDVTFLHMHCARTKLFPTVIATWSKMYHYPPLRAVEEANHCEWIERVGNLENHYHFVLSEGYDRHMPQLTAVLMQENRVTYVEQQMVKSHAKKDYTAPQDPNWNDQWSLKNSGQFGGQPDVDLNVEPAWLQGLTGKGVVVAFVDDGLEKDHPDLRDNFDSKASHDFVDGDNDPTPDYSADDTSEPNRHGTSCAGEVGMGKNGECGVGVAYESSIAGLRIDLGRSSDVIEADALGYMSDYIDIYSNSWGPADTGFTVERPGRLLSQTLENGVTYGRNGKGSIYVWAAGNGGHKGDSCATDAYASSIYTISVGSANGSGSQAYYDEDCSAKMVTTFSYNSKSKEQLSTTTLHGCCANDFTGTSAATPLVSGGIALALQANPNLTWRDVQHLLAYTSNTTSLVGGEWITNGAGLSVSHKFGFGAIDIEALVTRAQQWTGVPKQHSKSFPAFPPQIRSVNPGGQETLTFNVASDSELVFLEHVVVYMTLNITGYSKGYSYFDLLEFQRDNKDFDINFEYEDFDAKDNDNQYYNFLMASHPRRGDIQVTLTSPRGTTSTLLPYRERDFVNQVGYNEWPFMSVHFWGENPVGDWTAKVYYKSLSGRVQLTVQNMTLYGTVAEVPQAVRDCSTQNKTYCSECTRFRDASTLQCVDSCENGATEYEKYCIEGTVVRTTNGKRDYNCNSGPNTALIVGLSVSSGVLLIGCILIICLFSKLYHYCNRKSRARIVYGIVHADIDDEFDE